MDIRAYNREAWDREARRGCEWSVPVTPERVAAARQGDWSVLLTEGKPVPRSWFPDLKGLDLLGLASAGGQQGPLFAAAGARVTVFDNSPAQLGLDRMVAEREGLSLTTVEGDMRDLSAFADGSFDLVFNPASTLFVPEVRPVWREVARVLRPGGVLLTGFLNPHFYLFDLLKADAGEVALRFKLPYSDVEGLTPEELSAKLERGEPLEFSHTLEDFLAGQMEAGLMVTACYEDRHRNYCLSDYLPTYLATRAVKPRHPDCL